MSGSSAALEVGTPVKRWFFIGFALFAIALSIIGFAPSVLDQSARSGRPTPLIGAHGFVVAAWLLLLLTQATLAATGRIDLHRRLGRLGPVLAILIIGLGFLVLRSVAARGHDLSGDLRRSLSRSDRALQDPAGFLFPLSELVEFGALVAAAWWLRRRPEIHRRLMIFAVIPLLTEPLLHLIGHLASIWPALRGTGVTISTPIILALSWVPAIHDRLSRGRIHPVSLWIPVAFLGLPILLGAVVLPSAAWHAAAEWLFR